MIAKRYMLLLFFTTIIDQKLEETNYIHLENTKYKILLELIIFYYCLSLYQFLKSFNFYYLIIYLTHPCFIYTRFPQKVSLIKP